MDGLSALDEWKQLSDLIILSRTEASEKYSVNTLASKRKIQGALVPAQVSDIQKIVTIAHKYHLPLYPISCGHNWGYGGPTPVHDECFIVDLSRLNRIISFDKELGLVTVEPGVTQGQLDDYLIQHQLPFMVPITGGGTHCSLMGNLLEHGYGVNPYADHFAALMALEAVLPDGSTYRKAFADYTIAKAYKWGIGPYLDGLFSQSNFGIVTQVTIALAAKCKNVCNIFFKMHSDQQFFSLIPALREVLHAVGGVMGPIKITNVHQLSIEKTKRSDVPLWLATSAIYSDAKVVNAVKTVIKKKLQNYVDDISFSSTTQLNKLKRVYELLKFNQKVDDILTSIAKLKRLITVYAGHPNEDALIVPYLKSGTMGSPLNPDRDNCGLIWFTPLVAMKKEDVETYLAIAQSTLLAHQFQSLITMTSLSNYCFDSTVAILFDKNKQSEVENAHTCYQALFAACKEKGFLPYRLPIDYMHLIVDEENPHWKLVKRLKNAVDEHNIMAPGRYDF